MRYIQGRALITCLSNVICTATGILGAKGRTQKKMLSLLNFVQQVWIQPWLHQPKLSHGSV